LTSIEVFFCEGLTGEGVRRTGASAGVLESRKPAITRGLPASKQMTTGRL
jgi:hypothetical protein